MSTRIDFVKGHCGWDVVTLLPEGRVPATEELAAALKVISAPVDGGLEVGWLGFGERHNEIRLRMVNSTTKSWIPMCGGMTQVIGRALVETFLRDQFKVDVSRSTITVKLLTPAGEVPLTIENRDGKFVRATTIMDHYLSHVYESGIERLTLQGIPLLRVGKYAVIDLAALEERHRGVDFTRRDPGPHLDIVNDVLDAFRERMHLVGVNGMLYDERPEGPGWFRVFPRFYSADLSAARLPWEFQCGTGSIAVAVALAHQGRLGVAGQEEGALFEWGSYRTTPDPYGIRTSHLSLDITGRRVAKACFSHSVVEIIAEGTLTLPDY